MAKTFITGLFIGLVLGIGAALFYSQDKPTVRGESLSAETTNVINKEFQNLEQSLNATISAKLHHIETEQADVKLIVQSVVQELKKLADQTSQISQTDSNVETEPVLTSDQAIQQTDEQDEIGDEDIHKDYLNSITQEFLNQTIDPDWATDVEQTAWQHLAGQSGNSSYAELTSIQCRATLCEAFAQAPGLSELIRLQNLAIDKLGSLTSSIEFTEPEKIGQSYQIRFFLAKKGYDLSTLFPEQ